MPALEYLNLAWKDGEEVKHICLRAGMVVAAQIGLGDHVLKAGTPVRGLDKKTFWTEEAEVSNLSALEKFRVKSLERVNAECVVTFALAGSDENVEGVI